MASQTPNDQTAAINAGIAAIEGKRSNPFQLRFDLLHLAKDILEMNIHLAREAHEARAAHAANNDGEPDGFVPGSYTVADVISTAKELNVFVSNR